MQKSVALAATIVAFALAGASGCSSSEKTGCANNADCPAAHICQSSKCEKLCDSDLDCPAGTFCISGSVCEPGTRETPRIDAIIGNSPSTCDAAGVLGNCLGTGFVVQGQNLGGSSFALLSGHGATCNASTVITGITMSTGSTNESAQVDLIPAAAISATDYTLCAVNAAGAAQGDLTLLKGEDGADSTVPGPEGQKGDSCWDLNQDGNCNTSTEDINSSGTCDANDCFGVPGTAGANGIHCWDSNMNGTCDAGEDVKSPGGCDALDCQGADGTGGGGTTVHAYDAGSPSGVTIASTGDRALFIATVGTVLTVPQGLLSDLCGDVDGCEIAVGALGYQYPAEGNVDGSFWGPACRMAYNVGTGGWSVSQSCDWAYVSYWVGRSGNATVNENPVMELSGACFLSDASPGSSWRSYSADSTKDMYFFARPSNWTVNQGECAAATGSCVNDKWNQNPKGCALVIRN